jgi:hypothetical protein
MLGVKLLVIALGDDFKTPIWTTPIDLTRDDVQTLNTAIHLAHSYTMTGILIQPQRGDDA